jgi:hypothetical protein
VTWKSIYASKITSIAANKNPARVDGVGLFKTTKLYDRTSDQIDLDEIEKIRI